MLVSLKFKPGLVRDLTDYAGMGGWFDCNWVRFRNGLPEKMGGWTTKITTAFLGTCRQLISWVTLNGFTYVGLGTHLKYYVSAGGTYTDVTPIRLTTNPMANNPFSTTNGSTTVTVTDVANGSVMNDFVTFSGATGGFAGLVAADLNKEFQITSIIDADHYTIVLSVTPNATTTGGGAVAVAAYQINVGLDTSIIGTGWGAGAWGHDTWGSSSSTGPTLQLRLWTADTFGEDLVTNVRNGGIYYWDATTPATRMLALSATPGASDAPVVATKTNVSPEERHVIALGCNPIGSAVQDPLFVRWSDAEDAANWTPSATNSAGGYRLSIGTYIVGAEHTRNEFLVFTDMAAYSMTWTGAPFTFSFQIIGYNISMIAPNAIVSVNDFAAWMSREQFFIYDGRISPLPCPLSDYVFRRLNYAQINKIQAFSNAFFNEVGWLYPSTTNDCDSYVIFNYREQAWYFGSITRTAWIDMGPNYYPLATGTDDILYNHEFGLDDGSTNPPSAITAFIESSPVEATEEGSGDHYIFMDRLIPDITFRNSTAATPQVTMTLETQDFPGTAVAQTYPSTVASVTVDRFTQQCFVRLRGRSAKFKVVSDQLGVTWRLGAPRVSYRLDGRR